MNTVLRNWLEFLSFKTINLKFDKSAFTRPRFNQNFPLPPGRPGHDILAARRKSQRVGKRIPVTDPKDSARASVSSQSGGRSHYVKYGARLARLSACVRVNKCKDITVNFRVNRVLSRRLSAASRPSSRMPALPV